MARPCIGMSVSSEPPDPARALFRNKTLQYLEQGMILAVARAGGLPLLLPDLKDEALAPRVLGQCDGLLLSGGSDIAPVTYGEEPRREDWAGDRPRDLYELALLHAALARAMPVLGVCRGMQLINVAFGGTLWQDLAAEVQGALPHRDQDLYDTLAHEIRIDRESVLGRILGASSRTVNSVHHQGVRELAPGLRATARAPDGIIEAVEATEQKSFLLGVQWHPEWGEDGASDAVLGAFVAACVERRERR